MHHVGSFVWSITFKKYDEDGVDWIDLTRDGDRLHAVMNIGMNLQIP